MFFARSTNHSNIVRVGDFNGAILEVADLKAHLNVMIDDDDALIQSLRDTAVEYLEAVTGHVFLETEYTQTFDRFVDESYERLVPIEFRSVPYPAQADGLLLSRFPVVSAGFQIQYLDTEGNLQTLDASTYVLDTYARRPRIQLAYGQVWPLTLPQNNAVICSGNFGFADATKVPNWAKLACKQLVNLWYDVRPAMVAGMDIKSIPAPAGFDSILAPHVIWGW